MIHSEEHIKDVRFEWWNADYLDLLAERFALRKVSTILDVGVGLGHWSRLLLKRVASEWTFCGLDIEEHWVRKAQATFAAEFGDIAVGRMEFKKGDAHSLPYPDEAFDLVTCQTVLMHLRDPVKALHEMKRVLRVGGLVLCAEPINLINRCDFSTATEAADVQTLVDAYRLWIFFQRGIRRASQGDHNLGAYLPGLLEAVGFHCVQVYTNDKASMVVPSNYQPSERIAKWEDANVIRRQALEAGATEADVSAGLAALEALQVLKVEQLARSQFVQSGVSAMLVAGGRR
jgi:SAM-dependent methyltransferase